MNDVAELAKVWAAARPDHIYAKLLTGIAADPRLLSLADGAHEGQRVGLLLMAVIRFIVLGDPDEPLAAYYPTTDADPMPAFRSLVERRRDEIEHLVATRMVQTNEVGRTAVLVPALGMIQAEAGAPLALVEPGCSAGLNLCFDRYAYDWGFASLGSSTLRLRCAIKDDGFPPIPPAMPATSMRIGVDLNPPSLTDQRDVRWLRSLVWAHEADRQANLEAAIAIARRDAPRVMKADLFDALPRVCAGAPHDAALVVMHSMLCEHFTTEMRARFTDLMCSIGRARDLRWLSYELNGVMPPSDQIAPAQNREEIEALGWTLLRLVRFRNGEASEQMLALGHPHGSSMRWL